jgi:hypothetical protein
MTAPNRIEIDEQLRQDSAICKCGVETDFWQVVKLIGDRLKDDAMRGLVKVDPTDVGTIAQLQKTAQVVDMFILTIEDTARLT